jgi:ABC-type multidrug transport system fused ATPase/permease subunit
VRNADRIVVLERGRIVEQGRLAGLLERRGLYQHLCNRQLAS